MPRESVTSPKSGLDVDVSWSRDCGYVQIASTCHDLPRAVGVAREIVDYAKDHPTETLMRTGYHADLDRAAVNDLIRNLRRARDQAFGRDE